MGDYRTTTGEGLPAPKNVRRKRLRAGIMLAFLAGVAVFAAGMLIEIERYVAAFGYVTTEEHAEVRPPMSGLVAEILVDSGNEVEAGQVVVRLDSTQEMATLQEARAALRKTEAEAARKRIEIAARKRALEEDISVAGLRVENIETRLTRSRELFAKGLVPGSNVENLEFERQIAEAQLQSLRNRDIMLFDRELEVLEKDIQARHDAVETAALRVAQRDIKAPIGGIALRYEFVIGELVRPETLLLEIFGGRQQILKLKVAERHAAKIVVGQHCTAILSPYRRNREIVFEGKVEGLRNVIQGDGDGTYRVAYCSFDPLGMTIPPGTTAQARIYYGESNLWHWALGRE